MNDIFLTIVLVVIIMLAGLSMGVILGTDKSYAEYANTCRSSGGVPHEELCLSPSAMALVPLGFEKEDY